MTRLKDALTLDDLLTVQDEGLNLDENLLTSPGLDKNNLFELKEALDPTKEEENEDSIKANYQNQEDADFIAPLPSFKSKAQRRNKPDPRRQSVAIFSAFEATTTGGGLLDDSELAVGDADMELLIPLAKSSAALAAKGANSLWVDPDIEDELLESNLPEPSLEEMQAAAAAEPKAQARNLRDSTVLLSGFSKACDLSYGLDSIAESDFLPPRDAPAKPSLNSIEVAVAPEPFAKQEPKKEASAVRKPSRLRPPSSSSSYFTQTTSTSEIPKPAASAAVPNKKKASTSTAAAPVVSKPTVAPVAAPKPQPAVKPKPAVPALAAPRQPSRLPRTSRLPAPRPAVAAAAPKPRASPVEKKKPSVIERKIAAVSRPVVGTPVASAAVKVVEKASLPVAAEDSPNTAHLKWLEQHPELVFGGGAKIANSPEAEEAPRKKTAEELHYESWGNKLTALNDRK